ncbi:MAG: SDR family NAD(P)-dependent oxidoreductase, partial [Candidatus Rokubacteria bacterium]|nr:SDR family NAD(P)-dependent oxidoreductase [Candidatus Rokubacteria bacterium]
MDLGLEGKAALVAAASKGMGRACASGLAAEGVRVAICSRSADDLRKAADA